MMQVSALVRKPYPHLDCFISMNQIKALGSDAVMSGPLRPQMYEGLFNFAASVLL